LFGLLAVVGLFVVVVSGALAIKPPTSDVTASPSKINFGRVTFGDTGSKTVKITNASPAGIIFDHSTTGTDFNYSNLCATIAAGESCTMSINYQPSGVGKDPATTYSLVYVTAGLTTGYSLDFTVSGTGIAVK
jgi:hypothetical protein